jgi:hypothetical protein
LFLSTAGRRAGQYGENDLAHHHVPTLADTKTTLDGLGSKVFMIALAVGIIGIAASVGLGAAQGDGMKHFGFTYLVSYAFFLSISLGALVFIPIQYVTKASWSVVIRRLAEVMAAVLPLMAVLAIPVILLAGKIYGWAQPEALGNPMFAHKAEFLSMKWFIIRWVIYFVLWTGYALFFWRTSVKQDADGDLKLTRRLENFSGFSLMVCALSIALASMDLLMSIDYIWFSTMFGVYYWAGGFVSFFAVLTLVTMFLQNNGRMTRIVSPEHFHDYGKLMFAFTFFWGYIAFSQFMLYWYANIPEETAWYLHRIEGGWDKLAYTTLFATFLVPFAGLISRFAKRSRKILAFWACWIIIAQWLNVYWVVMPEFSKTLTFSIMDLTCFLGVGGLWIAGITRLAMGASLVPKADPRLDESLRFENA